MTSCARCDVLLGDGVRLVEDGELTQLQGAISLVYKISGAKKKYTHTSETCAIRNLIVRKRREN